MLRLRFSIVLIALLAIACGRVGFEEPGIRIVAITSPEIVFTPGRNALSVDMIIQNDTELTGVIGQATLNFLGEGSGFLAEVRDSFPLVLPKRAVTVRFVVRLPPSGQGSATIDGAVDIVALGKNKGFSPRGADSPLSFVFQPASGRDLSTLPTLTVNNLGDELDGGAAIDDPAQAGADLSLREALTINNNRGLGHRIIFDPIKFNLGGNILVQSAPLPTITSAGTAIDGGDLSIVITVNDELPIGAPTVSLRNVSITMPEGNTGVVVSASTSPDLEIADVNIAFIAPTICCFPAILEIATSPRTRIIDTNLDSPDIALQILGSQDVYVENVSFGGNAYIDDSPSFTLVNSSIYAGTLNMTSSPNTLVDEVTIESESAPLLRVEGSSHDTTLSGIFLRDAGGADFPLVISASQRVRITQTTVMEYVGPDAWVLLGGANNSIAAPVVTSATATEVQGTSTAPDDSVITLYADPSGEPRVIVGSGIVVGGAFLVQGLNLAANDLVTAMATDPDGNSSELAARVAVAP